MLTKQHIAISTWAMLSKGMSMIEVMLAIPYMVLPNAIQMFIGHRQPSHFEHHPSYPYVSWMRFPEGKMLKFLSEENLTDSVSWYVAEKIPAVAIGEETNIATFDKFNSDLAHHHEIRTHLVQDIILDTVLREQMIDPSDRFEDSYTVRHSGVKMDGKELRSQIALFQELGFIKLVGMVYKSTGVLLNKDWFDIYVQNALYDAYPEDMAQNTYRYMKISEELNHRLNAHNFELTQEEMDSVYMAEELDAILEAMYKEAFEATCNEF